MTNPQSLPAAGNQNDLHDIEEAEAFAISMEIFELMTDEKLTLEQACAKMATYSTLTKEAIKAITLSAGSDIFDSPVAPLLIEAAVAEQRSLLS
jgi:hypothetical protein